MTRLRLAPLAIVLLCLAACFAITPATAAEPVRVTATVDGRDIAGAGARDPVRLEPATVALVTVELENRSADPVTVRRVDLTGHVLGLNFFSYSTSVELTVAAGATGKLTYRLDPAGLDGQATGLIGSDLTVIGADGEPVGAVPTVIDVRGSLASVYGLFGIIMAVLTLLAIADAALSVARHRLAANRWQRGLRVLAPGIGIGLMIGFTASVARWWVPATSLWLALAGVTATVFFLAGYFSPTPTRPDYLGLDPEDLAAARELDAMGFTAASGAEPSGDGGQFAAVGAGFTPDARTGGNPEGAWSGGPEASFAAGRLGPGSGLPSPARADAAPRDEFDGGLPSTPASVAGVPGSGGDGPADPAAPRRWGWQPAPSEEPTQAVSLPPEMGKPGAVMSDSSEPGADEPTIRTTPGVQRFRPGGVTG
ncbi:hypothetical protein ACWDOP_19020 [Nocardia sp. NPDC003693]